ncbi:MAG: mechanosensitive ion channel family protein [Methylophilaceae bacterium]
MNSEIQSIWQEVLADISTSAAAWQLMVIVVALAIAWMINDGLRAYVSRRVQENLAHEDIKLAIGGINRVLFPLTALVLIWTAKLILVHWQHVGMLTLVTKLLLAMALIRLMVYGMRYIFSPSGWLKTLESLITWSIWGLLALHLSDFLPKITQALEEVQFTIGNNQVNLWLLAQGLLTIIATLFVALWLSRLLENKLMRAQQLSLNMRVVMVKLIRIVFVFIAVLIALSAVGLDITLLSVFGGALGVGLGFGLQKIASNYVSGFIILLDKSMNIGDIISVDKHYGVIHDMRSRYSVLSKLDGTHVIIPNETLITTAVINHSLTEHRARVPIRLAITFTSDLELAIALIRNTALSQARVLKTPEPDVHIKGFTEHGIELALIVWVADPEKGAAGLQSSLYMEIWKAFKQNRIEFTKLLVSNE